MCGGACVFLIFSLFCCVQDVSGGQRFSRKIVDCLIFDEIGMTLNNQLSVTLTAILNGVFTDGNQQILHSVPLMISINNPL